MKAKYILIVAAVLLFPAVSNAQVYGVAVPMQAQSSQLLDAPSQGYCPVQTIATETVGFSEGNHISGSAIATQSYQVHSSSACSSMASYVASSVSEQAGVSMHLIGVTLPRVWKGNVSDVGATSPSDNGRTKRKMSGFPGSNPGEIAPDSPAPIGDTPWLILLLCVAGYVLLRKSLHKQTNHVGARPR